MKIGLYKHVKTSNLYRVFETGKMKVNDEWMPCVFYKRAGMVFARELNDFKNKFVKH